MPHLVERVACGGSLPQATIPRRRTSGRLSCQLEHQCPNDGGSGLDLSNDRTGKMSHPIPVTSARTRLSRPGPRAPRPHHPTGYARRCCRAARSPAGQRHPRTGARDRAPRPRTCGRSVPAPPAWPPSRSPGSPVQLSAHPRSQPPAREITETAGPDVKMHAGLSSARQARTRYCRGPSVAVRGRPVVHTTRPGGQTPSAICPWPPRHSDPQRHAAGQRRNGPHSRELTASGPFP